MRIKNNLNISRQGRNEYPKQNERKEGYWLGQIFCRHCPLEHVTEGNTEEDRSQGKKRKRT
jgi:hypothetical protein